jgi:hypothetical protein
MARTSFMRLRRPNTAIITPARRYAAPMLRPHGMIAAALAALAAAAGPALAQSGPRKPPTVEASPLLWATVNVCDTDEHPDTIGVRGSMPGSRDGREIMFMRFQVQYFSAADDRWHRVRSGGDSGFVRVGRARYEARQAGRSFRFAPRTGAVLLRGVVTFEWRRDGEVVRRARQRTTRGHRSSAGDDPKGHSAPTCTIAA